MSQDLTYHLYLYIYPMDLAITVTGNNLLTVQSSMFNFQRGRSKEQVADGVDNNN